MSKQRSYQGDLERDKQCVELGMVANCTTNMRCSKCKNYDHFDGDIFDCIDEIYDSGWRVMNEKCLCPKCSEAKIIEYD